MPQPKLIIGVYNNEVDELVEAYEKVKTEIEEMTGFRVKKQDVWVKIIRAGFQALEQQKIQKAE